MVLGGTGFLGTRLVARLIKDGHRVTVLSRDRELHKHLLVLPGLTLENCDVYQEPQLSERFRGKDVVINLIGILNERGFSGAGFRRAHTELTRHVLAGGAIRRRRAPAASIGAEGGARRAQLLPANQGRGGKAHSRSERRGLDHLSTVGDVRSRRFVSESLCRIARRDPLRLPAGPAECALQPVWVDDVVDALLRCLHGGASQPANL